MSYKKKKKNQPLSLLRQLLFVIGWFLSSIAALLLAATPLTILDELGILSEIVTGRFPYILLLGLFISTFHHLFIHRILRFKISKWFLFSIIGWIISGLLPIVDLMPDFPNAYPLQEEFTGVLNLLIWTIPPSVLQWWLLRRYVRSAWLWLLANAVTITTLTITFLIASSRPTVLVLTFLLVLILQAILPAPIMIYLAKHARTSQGALQQSSQITETDDTATRLALTDDALAQDETTTTTSHPRLQAESR